jgi:hypothetical protein
MPGKVNAPFLKRDGCRCYYPRADPELTCARLPGPRTRIAHARLDRPFPYLRTGSRRVMSTGPESGGFTVIRRERIPFPLLSSARFGDLVATIGGGYHRVVRDGATRRTLRGNTKRIRAPSAPLRGYPADARSANQAAPRKICRCRGVAGFNHGCSRRFVPHLRYTLYC